MSNIPEEGVETESGYSDAPWIDALACPIIFTHHSTEGDI